MKSRSRAGPNAFGRARKMCSRRPASPPLGSPCRSARRIGMSGLPGCMCATCGATVRGTYGTPLVRVWRTCSMSSPGASCPARPVRVQQRRRLAPIPHTYSTEAPGRGCQLSSPRSAARGICCCAAATMSDRSRTCSQTGSSHHPLRPCLCTAAAHAPHTRPRPPPMSQRSCQYKSVGPRCSVTATGFYRLKGHCCK